MPFQIKHVCNTENNLNYVELYNDFSTSKIILNQGASLQKLTLNTTSVIKELSSISYKKSFAS